MHEAAISKAAPSARLEWATHWRLVLAATVGVSVPGAGFYALGQFLGDLQSTFGWSQTQIFSGLSIPAFAGFILSTPIGRLVDKINARYIAVSGVLLCALALSMLSQMNGNIYFWWSAWSIYALGSVMAGTTVWMASVTGAFVIGRSMALAIVLCGLGISSTVAPPLTRFLIDAYGWQTAFNLLALYWGGTCLTLTLLFFHDMRPKPNERVHNQQRSGTTSAILTLVANHAFVKFSLAVFFIMTIITVVMLNLSPILVLQGIEIRDAAQFSSLAGGGAIAGKLVAGYLFNRIRPDVLTGATMLCLASACLLLDQVPFGMTSVVVACLLIGTSAGSMVTIMACVTTRAFKPEEFGTVFGSLAAVMACAGITAPIIGGLTQDIWGSYAVPLRVGAALALFSGLLLRSLTRPDRAASH